MFEEELEPLRMKKLNMRRAHHASATRFINQIEAAAGAGEL